MAPSTGDRVWSILSVRLATPLTARPAHPATIQPTMTISSAETRCGMKSMAHAHVAVAKTPRSLGICTTSIGKD